MKTHEKEMTTNAAKHGHILDKGIPVGLSLFFQSYRDSSKQGIFAQPLELVH
jgi:hypothetical protein